MPLERIELLTNVWIDRYNELRKNPEIKYVMPFENRGEECGVTLHHPHGQIYAYPFIPPVIEKEIRAFNKENFLMIRRPPRSTHCISSAASDVYKRQEKIYR